MRHLMARLVRQIARPVVVALCRTPLLGWLRLEDRVNPATFVVDTLLDENTANATTSLREAISQANGNAGADTINFAPALNNGTITLVLSAIAGEQGLPALTGDTTITNTNAGSLTIRRSAAVADFTIFTINAGANVTFNGLTVTNPQPLLTTSSSTGGVRVAGGNLIVTNSLFTGNITNNHDSGQQWRADLHSCPDRRKQGVSRRDEHQCSDHRPARLRSPRRSGCASEHRCV